MKSKGGFRRPVPTNSATPGLDQLFQQGYSLHRQGKLIDAEKIYQQVLNQNPRHSDAHHLLGLIAHSHRQFDRAIALISQSIQENPNNPVANSNLGVVLYDINRIDEAIVRYDRAIHLKSDHAEAYSNRANALKSLKLYDRALEDCDKAIAISPGYADAHYNRGNVLTELEQFEEAVASYDRAITSRPSFPDAYCNRGNALKDLNRLEEALASYEQAISLRPDYAEAHSNRGTALHRLGRLDEALVNYERSMALKPDHAMAHWNRGLVLLLRGQFEPGWPEYEWRKPKEDPVRNRLFDKPLWKGEVSIRDKTILVHWEQGFGDTIQFGRLLTLLERAGAHVLFAPQKPIKRLMSTLSSSIEIVDLADPLPPFDVHCPLMSLPFALKIGAPAIPNAVPYLGAEPTLISHWRRKVGDNGFKIGVCWQGSRGSIDVGRSYPVNELHPLSQIPGVRLISLQKGDGEEQLIRLPAGMHIEALGPEFDAGPNAFLDTAAVMKGLDLVITSDTAVAHLAGALGVPTWVGLKHLPDWRWMLDRTDSPWYPTMRLLRQKFPDDWKGVFRAMEDALGEEIAAKR